MKETLIYKDQKSDKFWQIEVNGKEHTITYGKSGSKGTTKTKLFEVSEDALEDAKKLLASKLKKGYISIEGSKTNTYMPPNDDTNEFNVDWEDEKAVISFMDWLVNNVDDIERREGYSFYRIKNEKKEFIKPSKEDPYFNGQYCGNKNVYAFFRKISQYESVLPKLQKYVTTVDGDKWFDEETPLGLLAALTLALADKKYIEDYITYLATTDMNHEVYQYDHISFIASEYGVTPEVMKLMAARAVLPGQHSWEQFESFVEDFDREKLIEQLNYLLLASKKWDRKSHRGQTLRYIFEHIGFSLPEIWEQGLSNLVDVVKPNKFINFDSVFYYLGVQDKKPTTLSTQLPKSQQVLYLDLIEIELTNNNFDKAKLLIEALKKNKLKEGYGVVFHFLIASVFKMLEDNKKADIHKEKMEELLDKNPDMSIWTFKEFKAWLKSSKFTADQKKFLKDLCLTVEGGETKMYHMMQRKEKHLYRYSFEVFPKKIVKHRRGTENFKTEKECTEAVAKLLDELKKDGYFETISEDDEKYFKKAVKKSDLDKVKHFVEQNAQIDQDDASIVKLAMTNSSPEVFEYLLAELTDNYVDYRNKWQLHEQVKHSSSENIDVFLNSNYDFSEVKDIKEFYCFTANQMKLLTNKIPNWQHLDTYYLAYEMLWYEEKKNVELLEFLLSQGIRMNGETVHSDILQMAIEKKYDIKLLQKMVDNGGWLYFGNYYDNEDDGSKGFDDFIKKIKNPEIKSFVVDLRKKQETGNQLNHLLSNTTFLKDYLDNGGDVNWQDKYGWSLLHHVCAKEQEWVYIEFAKVLLEKGINPNLLDKEGRTAVFYLDDMHGSEKMASLIKEHGGDLEIKDKNGDTALFYQLKTRPHFPENGWPCVVKDIDRRRENAFTSLLNAGANVNAKDKHGNGPIHFLGQLRWPGEKVEEFIDAGVDLNTQNANGQTILHLYSTDKKLYKDKFSELLEGIFGVQNLNINQQDKDGNTPFHLASIHKRKHFLETGLPLRPNLQVKNNKGQTVIEILQNNGLYDDEDIRDLVDAIIGEEDQEETWKSLEFLDNPEPTDVKHMETDNLYPCFDTSPFESWVYANKEAVVVKGIFFDTKTGKEMFFKNINKIVPLDGDSIISTKKEVSRIKNKSGKKKWTFKMFLKGIKISGKFVYGISKNTLFALDVKSGEEQWSFTTKNISFFLSHNNQIFIVCKKDNKIHVLDYKTGKVTDEIKLDPKCVNLQVQNNTLYYLTQLSEQRFQVNWLDLTTKEIKSAIPQDPHFIWREKDLFLVNNKIYTILNHSSEDIGKEGIYEVKEDGSFEFCVPMVFVMRNYFIIGKECMYVQDIKKIIEINLTKKTTREIFLKSQIRDMYLNNGQLLVITEAFKDKCRLHIIK